MKKGNTRKQEIYFKDAYLKAVKTVSDKNGNWPKALDWGFLENRHIIRARDMKVELEVISYESACGGMREEFYPTRVAAN
jgi:hypothetical protein